MGCHRRSSRFIFDAFVRYNSKIVVPKNPIQAAISRTNLRTFSSRHNLSESRISELSQPILRNAALRNVGKVKELKSPFLLNNGAKRFYSVDTNQVHHFKRRGYARWLWNLENAVAVVWFGFTFVVAAYYGNWETVPYTERTHFVLYSTSKEKAKGEDKFKRKKARFDEKILPPLHPDSIRVQRIGQDIIECFRKGSRKEQVRLKEKRHREDLEGFNWEFIVVNSPIVIAGSSSGGKIVVFSGLLSHFTSDAEIAAIIGHQIGHAVARHYAEKLSKVALLPAFVGLILSLFFKSSIIKSVPYLGKFLTYPISRSFIFAITWKAVSYLLGRMTARKFEFEADYIGLLLLASSGYDPRVALQVREKIERFVPDELLEDYLCFHPNITKKRTQLLARAMEDALPIYRDVLAGRDGEGFG